MRSWTSLSIRPTLPGLALSLLVACGSPSEPTSPTAYRLDVEITTIWVDGDCEDTPGNPGEFAWRAYLQVTTPLGGSDVEETNGFPAESGALSYSEDDSPIVLSGIDLRIDDVPAQDVDEVLLTFSVVEWDPSGQDPDMAFVQTAGPIPLPSEVPHTHGLGVGSSSACMLRFWFETTWTALQ